MTCRVKFPPVLADQFACYRVTIIRGDFGQRPEYEAILQDIFPGQPNWRLVENELIVQQQVDVQRSRNEFFGAARTPRQIMDKLQLSEQRLRCQPSFDTGNRIQEISAVEA